MSETTFIELRSEAEAMEHGLTETWEQHGRPDGWVLYAERDGAYAAVSVTNEFSERASHAPEVLRGKLDQQIDALLKGREG